MLALHGLTDVRMTDAHPPDRREDAILEVPIPFALAGTWHAEIRGRLVDDDGEWCFQLG